jgi:hypothetical protein
MENQNDEAGFVVCQECGKKFKMITVNHLLKEHNMTFEEYKEKYPDAQITNRGFTARNIYRDSKLFTEDNKVIEKPMEDSLILENDLLLFKI